MERRKRFGTCGVRFSEDLLRRTAIYALFSEKPHGSVSDAGSDAACRGAAQRIGLRGIFMDFEPRCTVYACQDALPPMAVSFHYNADKIYGELSEHFERHRPADVHIFGRIDGAFTRSYLPIFPISAVIKDDNVFPVLQNPIAWRICSEKSDAKAKSGAGGALQGACKGMLPASTDEKSDVPVAFPDETSINESRIHGWKRFLTRMHTILMKNLRRTGRRRLKLFFDFLRFGMF